MATDDIEATVAKLLLEQREFRRLGLELPPDKLMLLKRLLYRLGWTKMSRTKNPRRYSTGNHGHEDFLRKIHAQQDEQMGPLVYADWLAEQGLPGAEKLVRGNQPFDTSSPMSPRYRSLAGDTIHTTFRPAFDLYPTLPSQDGDKRYIISLMGHYGAGNSERRIGFLKKVSPEEAHEIASGSPGVTNADHVVTELEGTHPWLKKPQQSSQMGRSSSQRTLPRRVVRLARLTLGKPVSHGQPFGGGGTINHHTIHDESGNQVGYVRIQPRDMGETLHVHWIGRNDMAPHHESANTLGPEGMRSLAPQLLTHYPNAQRVTGLRMTGFRGAGGAQRVVFPLRPQRMSRLPQRVIKFRSFEEKNNKVKREKENSKKPHLRRGQHVCRGCWKHYHVMPRANKCRACGGDVYTVTKSSRLASAGESPVRYTLDINETIRQGLNNSRIQGRGDNPNTLQDASAGAVLADALDETGRPHGPFFRNLIHRNDYWLHRDNPGVGYLVHPTGNYRTLLDSPHPLLARTETPDGARWSFRPARSEEGTHAVYATRSLPHTTGPSTRNVRSHEAILHAPHLREWATHPSIPPTMRATLLNMADHLESTGGKEKMSRRGLPKRYMTGPQDLLIELQKPEYGPHMAGLDNPLQGLRGVAADHMDEQGRHDEATLLRTPGAHIEVRGGKVMPSFMERQGIANTYGGPHVREQFVKPSYNGKHPDTEEFPDDHSFTYWFATRGHKGWYWSPGDGNAFHDEEIPRYHPDYLSYPRTDDLSDRHPLSPSEVAFMHHRATTPQFRRMTRPQLPRKVVRYTDPRRRDTMRNLREGLRARTPEQLAQYLVEIVRRRGGRVNRRHVINNSPFLADTLNIAHKYAVDNGLLRVEASPAARSGQGGDRGGGRPGTWYTLPYINEAAAAEHHRMTRSPKRYALANRSNFIDALRRIKSSNQEAMHEVARLAAQRLGLGPTKILNALHDTPQGAVPGVAQAVYGPAPESHLSALGAWLGLTGNLPGVAVFHTRPNGPDTLYRVRVQGSGAEARARLDRLGLRNRVMIPHRAGFDVLVADKGSNLAPAVREFARIHGSQTEESRGHLAVIGSADQARAREMFRNTVVAQEQGAARG